MQTLNELERDRWILFHKNAYKEDLGLSERLMLESPRWSIICGYYAMHDITKLYLGKIKGWKVSGEHVHAGAIDLLKEALREEPRKDRIIALLKEAENEIGEVLRIDEKTIVRMLIAGRSERGKAQYYSEKGGKELFDINFSRKASYFLEKIAKPFIGIMEGLCDNVS